jgi:hypothetical protein
VDESAETKSLEGKSMPPGEFLAKKVSAKKKNASGGCGAIAKNSKSSMLP